MDVFRGTSSVKEVALGAAAVTVIKVEPVMPPRVAEIVEVPVATAVARPALVIVATAGVADAQVTRLVRSCVEPPE